ncbi:hypothetical protein CDAR_391391 [Caerostris darwini]|uniref:Uncharacterized protein n=1 Tax=Caerostris darwini TaxID=1538125 RepID=A0AAV4WBZ0_9ARAC|nr:hypothetical protein CDAR_391391 [Caerostris darwini]
MDLTNPMESKQLPDFKGRERTLTFLRELEINYHQRGEGTLSRGKGRNFDFKLLQMFEIRVLVSPPPHPPPLGKCRKQSLEEFGEFH